VEINQLKEKITEALKCDLFGDIEFSQNEVEYLVSTTARILVNVAHSWSGTISVENSQLVALALINIAKQLKEYSEENFWSFAERTICLYKNLFPYDYALLESNKGGKGMIAQVINIKELRERVSKDNKQKIALQKKKIDDIKAERITSFEELRYMFVGQLCEYGQGSRHYGDGLIESLTIETFKGLDIAEVAHPSSEYYAIAIDSDWDANTIAHYYEREQFIDAKRDEGIDKEKEELARLEKEKQRLLSLKLVDIVRDKQVDFCFDKNLKESYLRAINATLPADDELFLDALASVNKKVDKALIGEIEEIYKKFKKAEYPVEVVESQIDYLRFLVANDYIDEQYLEYTSNYKAQHIKPKDLAFVMSVQRRVQDFECAIDDVITVIERLEDDDFKYATTINKILLENIAEIKATSIRENSQKYFNFMELLAKGKEDSILENLREFIATSELERTEALLEVLIPVRPTLFCELLEDDKLTQEAKNYTLICTIKFAVCYSEVNPKKKMAKFLFTVGNYLEFFSKVGNDALVIKFIDEVEPEFENLVWIKEESIIQENIISNNRYPLTLENLEVIFKIDPTVDFYGRVYDYVLSSGIIEVIEYVKSNINEFANGILLDENVTLNDEPQERIFELLKNAKIDFEVRIGIIRKVKDSKIKFDKLSDFDDALIESLLVNNKVEPAWTNVLYAFEKKGLSAVKDFLISNKSIGGSFIEGENGGDIHTKFLKAMVSELDVDEAKNILSKTRVSCGIDLLVGTEEVRDSVVAEFVAAGKIKYENNVLPNIYKMPATLGAYLKYFDKSIMSEFDVFFNAALPNVSTTHQRVVQNGMYVNKPVVNYTAKANGNTIIAAVVSSTASFVIKKNLVEKSISIIQIEGYERAYYEVLTKSSLPISVDLLYQFKDSILSADEKTNLAGQVVIRVESERVQLKEFLAVAIPALKPVIDGEKKTDKIKIESSNHEKLIRKLATLMDATPSKRGDSITLKFA